MVDRFAHLLRDLRGRSTPPLAVIVPHRQAAIVTPPQCDWAWRPGAWCVPVAALVKGVQSGADVGAGLKVFHDCDLRDVHLAQLANDPAAKAPYAMALEVGGFSGSFVSLVIDLPAPVRATMTRAHIFRVTGALEETRATVAYVRLNVKHGPNTERLVAPIAPGGFEVEFDLGHAQMNERRLETIWMDVIFERPARNRLVLRDLVCMRRLRAEL